MSDQSHTFRPAQVVCFFHLIRLPLALVGETVDRAIQPKGGIRP